MTKDIAAKVDGPNKVDGTYASIIKSILTDPMFRSELAEKPLETLSSLGVKINDATYNELKDKKLSDVAKPSRNYSCAAAVGYTLALCGATVLPGQFGYKSAIPTSAKKGAIFLG